MQTALPVSRNERAPILDALRGIAILGIILNNIYGFSGYGFLTDESREAFPTHAADEVLNFFQVVFIEGKFYSLFSLLFGIGFSIILLRTRAKGLNPLAVFYRRIGILLLIGAIHLYFFWEGDILFLYAVLGLLLPLFRNCSDKTLLTWAAFLILSPILIDTLVHWQGWNLAAPINSLGFSIDEKNGIPTDQTAATYLYKDGSGWTEWRRWQESAWVYRFSYLVHSNRIPKVMGIFLIGLYVGRKMIYANLAAHQSLLKKTMQAGFIIGIPASFAMAWFEGDAHYIPASAWGLADTISYALGVVPLSLAYAASMALLWLRNKRKILSIATPVGRMALTNYLMQSAICLTLFYGAGFGLGQQFGLTYLFLIAAGIYCLQVFFSVFWFRYFEFGPMEWLWRQLTYGKRLPVRKKSNHPAAHQDPNTIPAANETSMQKQEAE